jgi:chromosome segregation ATPase
MDIFSLLTLAGVAAFIYALNGAERTVPLKLRLDRARQALKSVEELKRDLYRQMKSCNDQVERERLASCLREEKEASARLRSACDQISASYSKWTLELKAQRENLDNAISVIKAFKEEKAAIRTNLNIYYDEIRPHQEALKSLYISARDRVQVFDFACKVNRAKNAISRRRRDIDRLKREIEMVENKISRQQRVVDGLRTAHESIKKQIFG